MYKVNIYNVDALSLDSNVAVRKTEIHRSLSTDVLIRSTYVKY